MEITKEQIEAVIKAILDKGLVFIQEDIIVKDSDKYVVNEIIPYTVAQLVCEYFGIEEWRFHK